jgi:hypothetical protein
MASLDSRFSYDAMVAASDRTSLVVDLGAELTRRLLASGDPEKESRRLVEELRALGHDLWSFDESIDFQDWCGDWVSPKQPYELFLSFSYREGEAPTAEALFQERRPGPKLVSAEGRERSAVTSLVSADRLEPSFVTNFVSHDRSEPSRASSLVTVDRSRRCVFTSATPKEGIMMKRATKTVKSGKKPTAAKTSVHKGAAEIALPPNAQVAYERYLTVASNLSSSVLVQFRGADLALARQNAQEGLDAIAPMRTRIAHELPGISLGTLSELPDIVLAVQFAVRHADTAPAASDIASNLSAAHALRGTLLTIADGLARAGLLPAEDVKRIKKGTGPIDAAADCVDLSTLFSKHEKKISGKHAATAQMLKSANEVGSYLLSTLKSSRAKEKKAVNGPALEARDRLWSLLVQRHKDLRRVGYYLWDESFNEHVPALLAHKRNAKPGAKSGKSGKSAPATKTNGAPAAATSPA